MIDLIKQNRFQELKEKLSSQPNEYAVHGFLLDVLNNSKIELDDQSFKTEKYQEEYLEGLSIYTVLEKSEMNADQLKEYLNILVQLAFKMSGYMRLMAKNAMDQGIYLSDREGYQVNPEIRDSLQNFIDILKNKADEDKAVANLAVAKVQISHAVPNLLQKHQIGEDMLQFAKSYENIGQTEMSIKIYQGIMADFECDSVKSSSGLLPEISHVDDRPVSEIEIFEKAKNSYERLTGQKVQEPKRVRMGDSEH